MNKKNIPVSEYQNIRETLERYVEALRVGNVDMLSGIFHKDVVTHGIVDGELVGGTGNLAAEFIRINGASPDIASHIDILDITPVTAVVRIIIENDAIGSDCCEYLNLIKTGGIWSVFSKAFLQFDK
ncbi:nuclear transport factor 2 family protein [Acetobacter oeni]|uniref:Nuclear transport factor 2 family protein n=1 Tax=Acetobacter oeni TaxID=304077 RepID=A0A511XPL6_9PROT|nr:nuclear transport factor 2 family protein [Acetobacter oeni]MBB3882045.1 hypothetical protein [Acetobacter oeni]GBR06941.1 hypothetical protein AA21952_2173 [Acetobacter oeni LMG 21952]GEN64903.1 hypothetical protein AOE01nite_31270 [Acetobacter oeni]